jgi:type III secretory pathway component EscT
MSVGPTAFSAPVLEAELLSLVLLWARLAPLFLLAPWLVLRAAPSLLSFALSLAGACALYPLALASSVAAVPNGLPLMAAYAIELTRGGVLALGCALPFVVFESSGVWADTLRGGLSVTGDASVLGRLYGFSALAIALAASAHLGVVRLFVDTLQAAPLGAPLSSDAALRSSLLAMSGWLLRAFTLGVLFAAPMLLSAWVISLLTSLLTRVAAPIAAPLGRSALLPWLGLAVVCLSTAGILDEVPSVVRLFNHETMRVLDALH